MLSYKWFQENQPIEYTGILKHILLWITSGMSDVIYDNPRYVPSVAGKGVMMVYLHGTADRVNAFDPIAQRILFHLPPNISKMLLMAFERRGQGIGIDEFAVQVLNKLKANNVEHVILVGHSRGGLVAAYFTEYLAELHNITVHSVITIGTPFQGSPMAYGPLSYFSTSVQQMQPDSPFLRDLNPKIRETQSQYFNIAAMKDGLVSIESACREDKIENTIIFDRHAHLSIMSSHRVVSYLHKCVISIIATAKEKFPELSLPEGAITPITEVCTDLMIEINRLKENIYMCSPLNKICVLMVLRDRFKDCKPDNVYHAKTIADYIKAFLLDADVCNGMKPIEIISEQLNYSFYLFAKAKPDSLLFIEWLINKFDKVEIPAIEKKPTETLTM